MHSECFDANPVHRKNEIEIYCKTRKELSHPPSPKYFFHQNTYRNNQQEKKFQKISIKFFPAIQNILPNFFKFNVHLCVSIEFLINNSHLI